MSVFTEVVMSHQVRTYGFQHVTYQGESVWVREMCGHVSKHDKVAICTGVLDPYGKFRGCKAHSASYHESFKPTQVSARGIELNGTPGTIRLINGRLMLVKPCCKLCRKMSVGVSGFCRAHNAKRQLTLLSADGEDAIIILLPPRKAFKSK